MLALLAAVAETSIEAISNEPANADAITIWLPGYQWKQSASTESDSALCAGGGAGTR